MPDPETTLESLARTVIREKIAHLNERERDLCARAYETYKSGPAGNVTPRVSGDRSTQNRARAILNGAGGLLPELPSTPEQSPMQTIEAELAATRIALKVLNDANLKKEMIEIGEWAVENTPAWRALMRKQILALAALFEANAACAAFLDAVDAGRANALPHLYHNVLDRGVFDLAVRDGLVKTSEIKGARLA
jgi:hypothetical protein